MKIGYVRVSSADQNDARQLENKELDIVFTDKASGKNAERPDLQRMLALLGTDKGNGHTVYVHSLDRLGRSILDVISLVKQITDSGAKLVFVTENMTFDRSDPDPRTELMFHLLAAFAQFQRSIIREAQREGIAVAKAKGKYRGRKPALSLESAKRIKQRVKHGGKVTDLAKEFGVSRETIYKALRTKA